MRHSILAYLVIILAMAITPVAAQESPAGCDAASEALETIAGLIADGGEPLEILAAIVDIVSSARTECEGLVFHSEVEGLQPVIGPIDIPEGFYRVTVVTQGYFILTVIALDGQCGEGTRMRETSILSVSDGEATQGAQGIVVSEGCEGLLQVENVTESWSLAFEKLR